MHDKTSMGRRRTLLAIGAIVAAGAPRAWAQSDAVRIGVPTATQIPLGRDCLDSVQLAVEEINARGGVLGRRLEVVSIDESGSAESAIHAIRKLTENDKVDVLIGGHASAMTLAQLPTIVQSKTLYLSVAGAAPAITQRVSKDYEKYRYVFRVGPLNAAQQAQALADFIAGYVIGEAGLRRVAFLGEDAKWVQDLLPILARSAIAAGGEVRASEVFDPALADFSAVLDKVRNAGTQFLVLIVSQGASDVLVRQWFDQRMPFALGGIDVKSAGADFYRQVGGKAVSQITANLAPPAPVTPKTLSYWDGFTRRSGRSAPMYTGPGAYDAVYVYADAVQRAQTVATEEVIKALEKTDYLGASGRIQFDENHDVRAGPGLLTLAFTQWTERGERAVVWPRELRGARPIAPPWLRAASEPRPDSRPEAAHVEPPKGELPRLEAWHPEPSRR